MLLAHIAGVPVQESLAYVLPVVVVVAFIYWSGFRERRRNGDAEASPDPATPEDTGARPLERLPE